MGPAAGLHLPHRHGREQLSAADASNVVIDARDQVNVFLMAGLLALGDPADPAGPGGPGGVDLERLRAELAERLADSVSDGLARFSQRITPEPPLHWEPCRPDLSRHVRQTEPVNGLAGLAALCGRLMTVPLPPDRPLWELLVVPGVAPGRAGIVLRVHHAVADGVGVVPMVQRLFGGEPAAPEPVRPPATATPRPRWRSLLVGVTRVLAVFRSTVGPTALLGPIGPQRGVAFAEVGLDALARAARAHGGTLNDALLAAVTGAVTAGLRAVGEPVPETLPASVPVALPDRGRSGNAVGVMRVALPVREPDAAARVGLLATATRQAKAEARSQGTFELTRTRWGSRLFARFARRQRFVALFVTNVRGPQRPLSVGGLPLVQAWPVAPIQGNVRLGVAAMSYAGRLGVAVHVDAAALPADLLARTLGEELQRIAEG